MIKKDILDFYSFDGPVWGAELNISSLFEKQPSPFRYFPVIKFPNISRDIAFVADPKVHFKDIAETIQRLSIPYLEKMLVCDRFSGPSVPQGKVSLSLRFVFRHPQRTLLTKEVDAFQQKIIETLKSKFGFQLRGGKIDK